ncbi:hypothetical protein [Lichenicola sp.]|uniref:hypothetical protein n=1 Tax=Lichenicola sp. TaxID=2804529 RepID=UPI003AFFABFB
MMRHPILDTLPRLLPWRCLAGALLAAATLPAPAALATDFTVVDGRAAEEISETSRLYIDGNLVGTFRLDDRTTEIRMPITLPDGPRIAHDYVLCGEITIRNRAGAPEIHEVSGEGVLRDPRGRVFVALGARDFTLFYLADPSDPAAVETQPGHSMFCQAPVS